MARGGGTTHSFAIGDAMRILLWIVAIIFIIGLLVVTGILGLIF